MHFQTSKEIIFVSCIWKQVTLVYSVFDIKVTVQSEMSKCHGLMNNFFCTEVSVKEYREKQYKQYAYKSI